MLEHHGSPSLIRALSSRLNFVLTNEISKIHVMHLIYLKTLKMLLEVSLK